MIFINWQQTPLVDFQQLKVSSKPHYCVVKPQCKGPRCMRSPVFPYPKKKLMSQWQQMIAQQPRVKLLKTNQQGNQMQYVQRSKWMRFPDIIDVRFVDLNDNQSTLYAYSRSVYGYSDLGVNCKRLKHWLYALQQMEGTP